LPQRTIFNYLLFLGKATWLLRHSIHPDILEMLPQTITCNWIDSVRLSLEKQKQSAAASQDSKLLLNTVLFSHELPDENQNPAILSGWMPLRYANKKAELSYSLCFEALPVF